MKKIVPLLLLFTILTQAQNGIDPQLLQKIAFKTDNLIAITQDSTFYYVNNTSFIKATSTKKLSYSNLELGDITTANTFNPLKINLFYSNFNTAIILDNRLAEMYKIDFNNLEHYKSISHITTGAGNTLWVFNDNTQQLELFDYKQNKTIHKTPPITTNVKALASNYNYCWLLTEKALYCYNYFGSLLYKWKQDNFNHIALANDQCIVKKENNLVIVSKNKETFTPILIKNIAIKQFFVTNQTLYIYDDDYIYKFKLK